MRINPRRFFEIFFLALLCVCLLMLWWYGTECWRAGQLHQEAALLAGIPDRASDTSEVLSDGTSAGAVSVGLDLSPLREVNADVVCWIEIPGVLSYPVLQGEDNAYYLSHAWDGEENAAGAVFLDYRASAGLTDFHTLLYGHRMRDGSMFGSLKQYSDVGFWQEHPSVCLSDEDGIRRYDIFAAYEVGVAEIVYRQDLSSAEDRQELLRFGLDNSVIDTGIVPTVTDTIITLSTCTGSGRNARWVVQAARCQEA